MDIQDVTITMADVRAYVEKQRGPYAVVGRCSSRGFCLVANTLRDKYGEDFIVDYLDETLRISLPDSFQRRTFEDEEGMNLAILAEHFDNLQLGNAEWEYPPQDYEVNKEEALWLLNELEGKVTA